MGLCMGHFASPAIFHTCAPLLKFIFFPHFRKSRGFDFNESAIFRFFHRFPVCLFSFFSPPPLILSLGPFRPMLAHHAPANRNLKNFDLDMFTLRQIKLHRMVNRSAFDLGAFYCAQNFLEASQDGSSPSLFVREAILWGFQKFLCMIKSPQIKCSSIHHPTN